MASDSEESMTGELEIVLPETDDEEEDVVANEVDGVDAMTGELPTVLPETEEEEEEEEDVVEMVSESGNEADIVENGEEEDQENPELQIVPPPERWRGDEDLQAHLSVEGTQRLLADRLRVHAQREQELGNGRQMPNGRYYYIDDSSDDTDDTEDSDDEFIRPTNSPLGYTPLDYAPTRFDSPGRVTPPIEDRRPSYSPHHFLPIPPGEDISDSDTDQPVAGTSQPTTDRQTQELNTGQAAAESVTESVTSEVNDIASEVTVSGSVSPVWLRNVNFASISNSASSPPPPSSSPPPPSSSPPQASNSSLLAFKSPKRPGPKKLFSSSPDSKAAASNNEEDGQTCIICFEGWTSSGLHRLVSLRCGHLFGKSCVVKWLKEQRKCPQCNAPARHKDVRQVYAQAVTMVDTCERDAALREAEQARKDKLAAEAEAASLRLRYSLAQHEVTKLKEELERQHQRHEHMRLKPHEGPLNPNSQTSQNGGHFVFDRLLKISESGECRVMAYNAQLACLCISVPINNALYPGYGIKKVSTLDLRSQQTIPIHKKPIRDLSFHPVVNEDMLLSASMDRCLNITNVNSNTVVQSYQCQSPVWSCAWNLDDRNYFFGGLQNGTINMYDMRNTREHVQSFSKQGACSPVISLQFLQQLSAPGEIKCGGLVVAQLNCTSFIKRDGPTYAHHNLPLTGSLTNLCAHSKTRHLMATNRPTTRQPNVVHKLYEFGTGPTMTFNCIHAFHGSSTQKRLTRNHLFSVPGHGEKLLVCASDESTQSVLLWDFETGKPMPKILCNSSVLDICAIDVQDSACLALLTDKELSIHKWQEQ